MTVKRVSKLNFDWDTIEKVSPAEGSFGAMREDIARGKKRAGKKSRTVLKKRSRD
jgi:hypothetical protein